MVADIEELENFDRNPRTKTQCKRSSNAWISQVVCKRSGSPKTLTSIRDHLARKVSQTGLSQENHKRTTLKLETISGPVLGTFHRHHAPPRVTLYGAE